MEHKPLEKYKVKLQELELGSTKDYTQIDCPSCSEIICAKDINIHDKIAKCDCCDSVFSIQEKIQSLNINVDPKQAVLRPEGIESFSYGNELELSVDQSFNFLDLVNSMLLLASFFINLKLFKENILSIIPIFLFLAPIFYFAYRFIKKPKTIIRVNNQSLSVNNRPLNFKKNIVFHTDDIDQVFVKKSDAYQVCVVLNTEKGQIQEKLLIGIMSPSKARYLEQEIEKHLGIQDRRIPEENL